MSYHNLRLFGPNGAEAAKCFDDWLFETLHEPDSEKREQLLAASEQAPAAKIAHPREEHLIPLMVAAGAAGADTASRIYNDCLTNIQRRNYGNGYLRLSIWLRQQP